MELLEVPAQLVAEGDLPGRPIPMRARFTAFSHLQSDRVAHKIDRKDDPRSPRASGWAEAAREYGVFLAFRIVDFDRGFRLIGFSQMGRQSLLHDQDALL